MFNASELAALNYCLTNATPTPVAHETTVERVVVKAKPVKALVVVDGSQAAPITSPASKTPPPPVMVLPEAGSIDAKDFLVARRWAKDRDESIIAIAAYIGYDLTQPFGTQDSLAVDAAKREINPPKAEAFKRSVIPSAAGYVKGAHVTGAREFQNLLGRERLAVDAMLDRRAAAIKATSDQERTLNEGLSLVEKERLAAVRADIKRSL